MADCEKCHGPAPIKGKVGFCPPKVVQINNPQGPTLFHCVTVPASMGDDTTYPPKPGMYKNILLYYEANDQVYLYSSDGIPTRLTTDITALKKQLADLEEGLGAETDAREAADDAIWEEIEEIEMSSDVVDIVGTYAELQQYDTSKLHDNDIIKVLQDETHDDETAYYRWSTATDTFSYVGSEGPYYTESEVDTLLSGKQDTLIAGTNIQIAADGKTISATDTTYSDFTGATSQEAGTHGLVPAPTTSNRADFLKGDGTWSNIDRFVHNKSTNGNIDTFEYYINSADGQHRIGVTIARDNTDYNIENVRMYLDDDDPALNILPEDKTQHKLVAGSNIQIAADGKTISATDTTYSAFTGATSGTAGASGLVPAPAAGDQSKVLKGDGTWSELQPGMTTYFLSSSLRSYQTDTAITVYKDAALTEAVTTSEFNEKAANGPVQLVWSDSGNVCNYYRIISAFDNYDGYAVYSDMYYYIYDNDSIYGDVIYILQVTSNTFQINANDTRMLQEKLTAGSNISISGATISATDTTYTAGTGIAISAQNVISASPNNISSNDWSGLWQ